MTVSVIHIGDLHFGRDADLDQIDALEELIPTLEPGVIAISGDLTQRARHGEFQRALAFVRVLGRTAPVLVVPGNHDVEWWRSPFGIFGQAPLYEKFRRYFGADLTPVLSVPGMIVAGALTARGVALGSMTWNLNDMAVKGHLPSAEAARVRKVFATAPPGTVKCLVMHHNVLAGEISGRMGLAHWKRSHRQIAESGADVVLCGHDHQEGAEQLDGRVVVSTSSTHTGRTRGKRAAAFNVVRVEPEATEVRHLRWENGTRGFMPASFERFARNLPR